MLLANLPRGRVVVRQMQGSIDVRKDDSSTSLVSWKKDVNGGKM